LRWESNSCIEGDPGFVGTIQIAKLPDGISESPYDASAGAYAVNCGITASASGSSARYSFSWAKSGLKNPLLMFALPHHVDAFDLATSRLITPIKLDTTTKGKAQGLLADQWTMVEKLYTDMGFEPYSVVNGPITNLSDAARTIISKVGAAEIEQDVMSQCCLDSMYFSGKGLGKFAMMVYALHEMALNPTLAKKGLTKLKAAIKVFIDNKQKNPLVYEEQWGGVVSTAGMDGDAGADFGGSYYNDHHFHYGYFVYTAAVIGYFDSAWLAESKNREWVNMLLRDFANPVCDDYFPFSRAFDWYNGHSWVSQPLSMILSV
jgi:endo-1,3(4)-beta-glucanase